MKKYTIALLSAFALTTLAAFAGESKSNGDCSACPACGSGSCAHATAAGAKKSAQLSTDKTAATPDAAKTKAQTKA